MTDRFAFAKKFLTPKKFEQFKDKIRENVEKSEELDFILLFGKQKESEAILQNYLNRTNDIQKVAIISLYLKYSSERDTKSSFYDNFINIYKALIELQSHKNYRLIFDKKCL